MHFFKKQTRDKSLDALKGIAVILMLMAHAENIFNNSKSAELHIFDTIGTTLAFSVFVLASGISAYLAYYTKYLTFDQRLLKMIKRGVIIYLAYAFLNYLALLSGGNGGDLRKYFIALTLVQPLIYTEFLIPLMFFPLWIFVVQKIEKFTFKNIYIFCLILLGLYALSAYFATLVMPFEIKPYADLLFGTANQYKYPFIQYSLVYLCGMRLAMYLKSTPTPKKLNRDLGQLLLITIMFSLIVYFAGSALPVNLGLFSRWPPGLGFLLMGIVFCIVTYYLNNLFPKWFGWDHFAAVGRLAFWVFVVHIALLFSYRGLLNYQFDNVILGMMAMLCFIILSILLTKALLGIISELSERQYTSLATTSLSAIYGMIFIWLVIGLIYTEAKVIKNFSAPAVAGISLTDNSDRIPNLETYVTRKWVIKNTKLPSDYTTGTLGVRLDYPLGVTDQIEVTVSGSKGAEKFTAEKIDTYNYKFILDSSQWEAGEYKFTASVKGKNIVGSESSFNISYPLFVTWSIDYEGFDVADKNLAAMASIAADYNMPITHMFNPRIFVAPEISAKRRIYLANWVLDRQKKYNEEIALHLHMQYDMITAVGLVPKTVPVWSNRANGQSVLTTAYDYNDFTAIILWAKDKFKEYGLPVPYTYRAGGWFIGSPQLRVLQDQGFTIDTSGHPKMRWGTQQEPWTLTETTTPYHPSTVNQNKSSPAPLLTLWEFPDNGWDSTNNDVNVLKKAFDANYIGKPLIKAQTLTYLSHPNVFADVDTKRMRILFDYIGVNKVSNDSGPLFYLTLQDSLKYWE